MYCGPPAFSKAIDWHGRHSQWDHRTASFELDGSAWNGIVQYVYPSSDEGGTNCNVEPVLVWRAQLHNEDVSRLKDQDNALPRDGTQSFTYCSLTPECLQHGVTANVEMTGVRLQVRTNQGEYADALARPCRLTG